MYWCFFFFIIDTHYLNKPQKQQSTFYSGIYYLPQACMFKLTDYLSLCFSVNDTCLSYFNQLLSFEFIHIQVSTSVRGALSMYQNFTISQKQSCEFNEHLINNAQHISALVTVTANNKQHECNTNVKLIYSKSRKINRKTNSSKSDHIGW